MDHLSDSDGQPVDGELTRRRLLAVGATGALTLGAGPLLAACGSGSSTKHTSLGGGKPVRGGTLTIGMLTGGSAETVNPGLSVSYLDILRLNQLYDWLVLPGEDIKTLVPSLATSAEPNADATVWTIRLRDGVNWHDGKPFTADDVVWTVKSWSNPTNQMFGGAGPFIDFKGVRKRDRLTMEIPLTRPAAQFSSFLTFPSAAVIQNGASAKSVSTHPIGTGPFKFQSFTPGSQSVFVRNPNYWRAPGKPYLDKLVINSAFSDETSRDNSLLGGQIDVAPVYSNSKAKQQQSGGQVNLLIAPGSAPFYFTMRVDKGEFADVRVRQAMKLLIDRKAMIDDILYGYATLGTDNYSLYEQYAINVPATHDVEKAKSLLKAAGLSSVTVAVAPAGPGYVESVTLLSQQAKAAGLTVNVQTVSTSTYFTSAGGYLSRSFGVDTGITVNSQTIWAGFEFLKGCSINETGWPNQPGGGDQALLNKAIGAINPTQAASLWAEVQHQQLSQGGLLIWAWPSWIDAAATHVKGLSAGKTGPMNNYQVLDAWKTA
jgi:peptide/nickel transport system substrate-binding protein